MVGRHDEDLLLCFESLQGGFGKALTNELVSSCSDWKSEKKENEKFLMSMKTDFYFLNVSHPS